MKAEDIHKNVVEIEKLIAGILQELKQYGKTLDSLHDAGRDSTQSQNDLRRSCENQFVGIVKDIDEFRRWTEKNSLSDTKSKLDVIAEKVSKLEAVHERIGTRAWSVVPNITGAVFNVLLAAIVAFIVTKLTK